MTPKISVIVPCYNQAQYLDECLQSVLDQTYQNWECMIVNDGSPDHTAEIAQQWLQKDQRFKYIYKQNGGVSSARNIGIETAVGEYILPLDADDKIGCVYLHMGLEAFEDDENLKVVYCKAEKFGIESGPWILPEFTLKILSRTNMIFCSALYKKSDWKTIGGYDVNMDSGLEDWEFWIAILKNGGKVKVLKELAFFYRVKLTSRTTELKSQHHSLLIKYLSIKHVTFFVEHYGTFHEMSSEIQKQKNEFEYKLQSEKFILNAFLKVFFGFKIKLLDS